MVLLDFIQKNSTIPFVLNGNPTSGSSTFDVCCPYDGSFVGRVSRPDVSHLHQAIADVQAAFEETRRLSTSDRIDILNTIATSLNKAKEDFALIIALEAGKPIKLARSEVDRAVSVFESAVAETRHLFGGEVLGGIDVIPAFQNHWGITRRVPIGPIAAITPFNFPLNLVCHKIGPAIASGCPIVLKPASQTPLSALCLAKIICDETKWPKKAISVLPLTSNDSELLITDDSVFRLLSFTGSAEVGWQLLKKTGRQRVILELGGNAAVLVCDDADIDLAVSKIVVGGFSFSGQSCISVQRVFIQEGVFDEVCAKLKESVKNVKHGSPRDETADLCCMISRNDAARVDRLLSECRSAGCEFLFGGDVDGSYVSPTAILEPPTHFKICSEEVFAPVICVYKFRSLGEGIRKVNESKYGLQAAIFATNISTIMAAFDSIHVGGLIVNDSCSYRADPMPYGGVKGSGQGKEGVKYAMEEMTELKLLLFNKIQTSLEDD